MLKIGEFSRLGQVTIKTLHHYDDLGLIQPAHIDALTNYRFYTVEQLPRLHRIMALKELGLALEQIRLLIDDELTTEEIRGMLHLKQAELQQHVREEQARLSMVEFRLRMLEAEKDFPILDVVIKQVFPLHVLSMHIDSGQEMAVLAREIRNAIDSGAIHYAGVGIDQLNENEDGHEINPNYSRHEVILVVDDDQPGDVELETQGVLVLRDEPGIDKAATLMLQGVSRDERMEKIALLQRWAVAHGYRLCKRLRVLNHRGPLETPDRYKWVTEIQLSVESSESGNRQT